MYLTNTLNKRISYGVLGFVIGAFVHSLFVDRQRILYSKSQVQQEERITQTPKPPDPKLNEDQQDEVLQTILKYCPAGVTSVRKRAKQDYGPHTEVGEMAEPPVTPRDVLFDKVKVLIWVATHKKNLNRQAKAVQQTWARRANKVLFMSSETSEFPTVEIKVPDGREHLTAKTMKSFRYVYEHHFDDADWFMKADDDTFVVVENLRKFLEDKNPEEPHYFGQHFNWVTPGGYNSGGAGFVISKETLRRFAKANFGAKCRQDGGAEDVNWGKCMHSLGVHPGDSRDKNNRTQFHGFTPDLFMIGDFPVWYPKSDRWGGKHGIDSVSENAITFHHIPWPEMYLMEYYTYHLRPHGVKVT